MSKISKLVNSKTNNMIVKESNRGDIYTATIKAKDKNNFLRLLVRENKIAVKIVDKKGSILEKYTADCESDEEVNNQIDTALDIYEAIDNLGDNKEDDQEILVEEPEDSKFSSMEMGLVSVKDSVTSIANDIKSLSDMTNDIEFTTIIMDIANTLYNTALDIEEAVETYKELTAEDDIVDIDNSDE